MPWFRFIGEDGARVTLRFRNGKCELTFANLGNFEAGWAWVAQRDSGARIVLVAKPNVMALQSALVWEGFEVAAGSPAERVMRAAVKCRHAEELPEEERWRTELIRARGRQPGTSF